MASEWDRVHPLIDPFSGSGTIPIEAALLARRIPPGLHRRFGFQQWPGYESARWDALVESARERILPAAPGPILGSDRDAGAVEAAQVECRAGRRRLRPALSESQRVGAPFAGTDRLGGDQSALWHQGRRTATAARSLCQVRERTAERISRLVSHDPGRRWRVGATAGNPASHVALDQQWWDSRAGALHTARKRLALISR